MGLYYYLSKKEDFENIPYFLTKIAEYFELEEFPILLVGNKADLEKKVKQEEIDELSAKEKFIGYFEVSCKNLTNVDESFSYMLDYIREKEKDFPCPKIKKTTKKKKEKK